MVKAPTMKVKTVSRPVEMAARAFRPSLSAMAVPKMETTRHQAFKMMLISSWVVLSVTVELR